MGSMGDLYSSSEDGEVRKNILFWKINFEKGNFLKPL